MNAFRLALGSCAVIAILAACSGSQPPIGTPGAVPQARHSSGRPASSSGDLIYAVGGNNVYIYTYPEGSLVTDIPLSSLINLCSDLSGNVFITATGGGSKGGIREYAHGETYQEQTLFFSGYPASCSVDPTTGNLAVTNDSSSGSGDIGIYQDATGSPTYYTASNLTHYNACAYDDQGNLFVDGDNGSGEVLDVLFRGSSSFATVSLKKTPKGTFGKLLWQGSYLAMSVGSNQTVYHIKVSGSNGTISGKTRAKKLQAGWWIQAGTLLSPYGKRSAEIAFWNYPKGGMAARTVDADVTLNALTVSVAQSRKGLQH